MLLRIWQIVVHVHPKNVYTFFALANVLIIKYIARLANVPYRSSEAVFLFQGPYYVVG